MDNVEWKTRDDGQRNCPKHVEFYSKNKFEKLMHLVGFFFLSEVSWTDPEDSDKLHVLKRMFARNISIEFCGLGSFNIYTVSINIPVSAMIRYFQHEIIERLLRRHALPAASYTERFTVYSEITNIHYRKTLRHIFTKPVQIGETTQFPHPPVSLFFIVVHISAARRCECM